MCKHILFNDFNGENDLQTLYRFAEKTYDKDGFGAILRDSSNTIHTLKGLDKTAFYLKLGTYVERYDIKTLVVHHRTSTNGDGLEYAHPFELNGNFLTHNGVVSVPNGMAYPTKTTNDSEMLLHHLMATDFDTPTIQGYYSCFILNEKETIVLVDATAPIYTNGRTYSSHKLGKRWKKIEKKRIHLPIDGSKPVEFDIEVAVSTYGASYYSKSLGTAYSDDNYGWSNIDGWNAGIEKESTGLSFRDEKEYDGGIIDFLDFVSDREEELIEAARTFTELMSIITDISYDIGLRLCKDQIEDIAAHYIDNDKENKGSESA